MDFDIINDTIIPITTTSLLISATGALGLPVGTTVQRPANSTGLIRYNTTTVKPEYNTGTAWLELSQGISILQIIAGVFTPSTGTPATPAAYDGTVPASTEGTLVWTQAITPSSASSRIKIDISTLFGCANNGAKPVLALFRGTTNIGTIAFDAVFSLGSGSGSVPGSFSLIDSPASAAAVTYTLRASATTGVYYFGRGAQTLGNAAAGNYTLMEIL